MLCEYVCNQRKLELLLYVNIENNKLNARMVYVSAKLQKKKNSKKKAYMAYVLNRNETIIANSKLRIRMYAK